MSIALGSEEHEMMLVCMVQGDITDEDGNVALLSGRVISVPIEAGLAEDERTKNDYYAFVGGIDYYLMRK
jgi:hypothetical protein